MVVLHKCLSAFCSPLFSVPNVISPLAFLLFLRSSCGYLFCPFSYGVFSFSTSSFVASASSTRQPTPLPLPAPSGFLVPPLSLPPVSRLGGGLYPWSSAQVLPQAPIGVSSLSTASPLLSVPHPAVPSSSLPAFQLQGVSGFYPLTLLSCLRLP